MGGLVAAAAVAAYFDRVTVLDRDELPAEPAPRRGVPQGRHAHGFQPGGLRALDQLLPGTTAKLAAGGAPSGDTGLNSSWYVGGVDFARGESGIVTMGFTRPYVEHVVRSEVSGLANVTLRDRTEVLGVRATGSAVTGVQVRTEGADPEDLATDLVIDASGRASRLPEWLADLGLPTPAEEQVHCKMAYLSRRWILPEGAAGCAPRTRPHGSASASVRRTAATSSRSADC
jgi:2-polyprenyl-6-methoxyphenol hydroxylase-like FAD-dependent oxidoreductase